MVQVTLSLHRQRLLLSHTDWDRGTLYAPPLPYRGLRRAEHRAHLHSGLARRRGAQVGLNALRRVSPQRVDILSGDSCPRSGKGVFRGRGLDMTGAAAATEALARRSK